MDHKKQLEKAREIQCVRQLQLLQGYARSSVLQSEYAKAHGAYVQAQDALQRQRSNWRDAMSYAGVVSPVLALNATTAIGLLNSTQAIAAHVVQEVERKLDQHRLEIERQILQAKCADDSVTQARRDFDRIAQERLLERSIETYQRKKGAICWWL